MSRVPVPAWRCQLTAWKTVNVLDNDDFGCPVAPWNRSAECLGLSFIALGRVDGEAELTLGFLIEGNLYLFKLQVAARTESEGTGLVG